MRSGLKFIAGLLLITSPARSQWSLDGYVVTFPTSVHLQPDLARLTGYSATSFIGITRTRLRPTMDISSSSYLRVEYEMAATYSSSRSTLLAAGAPRGQVVDLTWAIHDGSTWDVLHGIDRLFVKTFVGDVDLTLGRQRIAWGAGRVWNPTDLFNPLNPANFSKIEKDGVDAAVATIRVGDLSDVTAVWNPQKGAQSSGGLRARTNWEGIDAAAMAGRFEDRWIFGGDVTGSILDAGVRAEGVYVAPRVGPAYVRYVLGIDNQFTGRWYAMAEYLHNGEGSSERTRYELGRLLSGQVLHVARHYLMVQSSYLIHPLVSAQASLLRNLDDGSGFASGTVNLSVTDESSIALGGQFTFGSPSSEYWYYPRTLYLRADLFF